MIALLTVNISRQVLQTLLPCLVGHHEILPNTAMNSLQNNASSKQLYSSKYASKACLKNTTEWFCFLVESIELTTENVLKDRDIDLARRKMNGFIKYYEEEFYGNNWNKWSACLPFSVSCFMSPMH